MAPRLSKLSATACCRAALAPSSTTPSSLIASLARLNINSTWQRQTAPSNSQARHASILTNLRNVKGATKTRKRVGRGPSSGHGKTSGRGHKGQKQHGSVNPWFQGGQTPLIVKHGQMGFLNHRAAKLSTVNLDQIQLWIDQGRLDPKSQITPKELIQSKLIGSIKDGVKILSRGAPMLKQPIDVMVSRVSLSAIEAIEAAGGTVTTRYYTKLSIKRLIKGESINTDKPLPIGQEFVQQVLDEKKRLGWKYRLPDPTSRKDFEYYRDPAHRGYLAHLLKRGESPSLYFKVPGQRKIRGVKSAKQKQDSETLF